MIFHLMSAGVPVSWTIVSVYKNGYGIAHRAATAWMEQEERDRKDSPYTSASSMPTPHLLLELKQTETAWAVKRSDLLMSERYLQRQEHDERSWLLQGDSSPFPLEDDLEAAVTQALHTALKDFGYLIPRGEWERRYPAQKLVADHFRAFNAAYDAHKASGSPGRMPFELRWAQYMESPPGFVWPFDVEQDGDSWLVTEHGRPFGDLSSPSRDDAEAMMRLLNGGYRLEDVPVMMADQPVEETPA